MREILTVLSAAGLFTACATPGAKEDPSKWYESPGDYDVMEPVAFTDEPYDFTGDTPIADLPLPEPFTTAFGAGAELPGGCPDWTTTPELPAEITGVVTIMPRYYFKTSGCAADPSIDEDEKYYGSYFVQDQSGGFFVLGDSKVAHFDMGARVTLRVNAVKESFEQFMIISHDVLQVERGPEPISYERVTTELGPEQVAKVVRVEGTIATPVSTFGEVYLDSDDGVRFKFNLDAELNRRGVAPAVGDKVRVTGPVLYSFSEYTIVVMRVGQLETLGD